MIRINKLLVFFTLFNQMVCPPKEEINEEGLCLTIKMLYKIRSNESSKDISNCFSFLIPIRNILRLLRFNNKVLSFTNLPKNALRSISSCLLSSKEKLCKDIEEKIKESLKIKGKEGKAEVSKVKLNEDHTVKELTVTIGGIKHEGVRPFVVYDFVNKRKCILVTKELFKKLINRDTIFAHEKSHKICDFKISNKDIRFGSVQHLYSAIERRPIIYIK